MQRQRLRGWEVAFSDRADGDLRVSARTASEPLAAVQERVLADLGVDAVVVARQVHGTDVVSVTERPAGYVVGLAEGDAVATRLRRVAAAVHVGDCLPIAVGCEQGVAMLHGGWRGLADGVLAAGVRALRELGVAAPLEAVIGPGAGACCYEVGEELREHFGVRAGRTLDLAAFAESQLRELGVAAVRRTGICTICDARFFSHRREGPSTGRQGGFAWLR